MKRLRGKGRALFLICFFLAVAASFAFVKFAEREKAAGSPEELKREWQQASPGGRVLRSGDLIFRHSRGTISNMLLHFSRSDARYSHAGILSVEGGQVFVYHALGGEATRHSELRREPLETFCRPATVHSFGIYRLDLSREQLSKALSLAKKDWLERIPFDTKYDLQSDSAMYCTEFVYKVVMQASGDKNYITLTKVPGFTYVACDNLYRNKHATLIYSHAYSD